MGAAFVKIPRLLLEQNSGPGAHRRYLLYGHIQSHCSASGQGCWASIATLAREAGLGVRTVKRALRELLEQGWVVQELRPGNSSVLRALEAPVPNPNQTRAKSGQQRSAFGTGAGSLVARPPCQIQHGTRATRDPQIRIQETRTQDQEQILTPSFSPPAPLAPAAQTRAAARANGEQPKQSEQGQQPEQGEQPPGPGPGPQLSHPPYRTFSPPEALQLEWQSYTPEKLAWIPTHPRPSAADLPAGYPFCLEDVVDAWARSQQRWAASEIVCNTAINPRQRHPEQWADDATAWQLLRNRIPIPLGDDDVWLPVQAADLPLPVDRLPRCLQGIAADLEHYWHAKRGPRSTAAFRAAITQLTPLVLERGPLQIAAFLNAAAQAGYPQLDYGRWEARERGFALP